MLDTIRSNLRWFGHDAFLLQIEGKTIYFDPFRLPEIDLPKANLVCISHAHYDHCSPEDLKKIRQHSTLIVTEAEAAAQLEGPATVLVPGEGLELAGMQLEAVPAYNLNKPFHPKEKHWLGFILGLAGGIRLYHAGDTDLIPEMASIQADIALLPVSGTYVMTAEEAVQAALLIEPMLAIPMHFGSLGGKADDGHRFAAGLAGRIRVEILDQA